MDDRLQRLGRMAFYLAAGMVAVLSLLPRQSAPDVGLDDKVAHFLAYACLGFLGQLTARRRSDAITGILGLIAFGVVLEFLQAFSPGRSPEFADALADALGVCIGGMLVLLWRWLRAPALR